ncbi:MAG: hypothetical protein QG608_1910 [Actinomycetota bacterium]|nr:hypothetical protein [Actinomycetota bacterium]
MSLRVSTNGSLLSRPAVLELLTGRPPVEITVSVYGASRAAAAAVTGHPQAQELTERGVRAAVAAGVAVAVRIVVTAVNAGEVVLMREAARTWGVPVTVYTQMSPGLHGDTAPLDLQAPGTHGRSPMRGACDAGTASLHVDPAGRAHLCKAARSQGVDLVGRGAGALEELRALAAWTWAGGAGPGGLCPPMSALYRAEASASAGMAAERNKP